MEDNEDMSLTGLRMVCSDVTGRDELIRTVYCDVLKRSACTYSHMRLNLSL